MPKSPQDIYARHLLSPRGYPLWTPEPSQQLLAYRRDGLRIGNVGVVIPEDGCFDVFFNLCLPHDHAFHRATGVPDNFKPIELDDIDIRTVPNAEHPGRIIATSSVKTVRSTASGESRSSGLEYEFNLSSSEGALLILPEGAERRDLRNHHRFLEAATRHGADWYRFAEERVGQIISNDSLYLITGLYKTRSWSLAAFEKTAESGEHPAQCRLSQVGRDTITAACTWETTRALDWRVGPIDNYGIPNQAAFIRGFKVAHRTGMFGTRWITVKADAPCTRPNPVKSSAALPGDSWLAYIFGGQSFGNNTGSSSSNTRDESAADPALDAARNEIQNNGALAVGEHVVVQRMPEASQAFHPSDIINQYLLDKNPSANIAVTHDNDWIALLEENLLQAEDFVQEGLLETLVSQNYHVITEAEAVYLRNRNIDPSASDTNRIEEGRELDSESSAMTIVNATRSTEQGVVTALCTKDVTRTPDDAQLGLASVKSHSDSGCHPVVCLWEDENERGHTSTTVAYERAQRACDDCRASRKKCEYKGDSTSCLRCERYNKACSSSSVAAASGICGATLSCEDVPAHFRDVHTVKNLNSYQIICCKWKGCGIQIKRESIVRHIREVHLKHHRSHDLKPRVKIPSTFTSPVLSGRLPVEISDWSSLRSSLRPSELMVQEADPTTAYPFFPDHALE